MKTLPVLPALGVAMLMAAVAPSARAAIVAGDVLYIDFGKNNTTDGIAMASPDTYGHYWNDAIYNTSAAGGAGINGNPAVTPLTNMITIANVATGVGLNFSNGWQANGFNNGGLANPSAGLLGDFAFKNVTGDYFFFDTSTNTPANCTLTFTGLDPSLTYDFSFFASRDTTETRTTSYAITDTNGLHTVNLAVGGAGIGAGGTNGNNNTFANLQGIVPTAGSVTITVDNAASAFAYVGAMKLTATPEPGSAMLAALGAAMMVLRRRRNA